MAPDPGSPFEAFGDGVEGNAGRGYIMLDPEGSWQAGEEHLPDHWFSSRRRLYKNYRRFVPK